MMCNPWPALSAVEQGIGITKHSAAYLGRTQERLAITLTLLLEDPAGATINRLAAEAAGAAPSSNGAPAAPAPGSLWIAPAPAPVRMRLFCLPYAGGVSENVFARRARLGYLGNGVGHRVCMPYLDGVSENVYARYAGCRHEWLG